MYRVGIPGWKVAARLGWPVTVRVQVASDTEAGVYIATSPDLDGLVLEAKTLDDLRDEVRLGIQELLTLAIDGHKHSPITAKPQLSFNDDALCIA